MYGNQALYHKDYHRSQYEHYVISLLSSIITLSAMYINNYLRKNEEWEPWLLRNLFFITELKSVWPKALVFTEHMLC